MRKKGEECRRTCRVRSWVLRMIDDHEGRKRIADWSMKLSKDVTA